MARNQISISGPKKRPMPPVPWRCTMKSTASTTSVMGKTQCASCGDTSVKPSTAESTEMAGVMTPSP